jgi:hypothetical protein
VGTNGPVFYWLDPKWTSTVPQFLLIIAYSAVFVAFMVWLFGLDNAPTETDSPATATS